MARNYGPGSFRDQWDNEDLITNDYFPPKGEAYRKHREGPRRDADLGLDQMGTDWNQQDMHYGGRADLHWNNLSRSDLRPDLHDESDHYGKGPRGYLKSDEALKEDVSEVLHRSLEVDASDIVVKVEDRCVYLEGSIQTRGMKIVAEDLVGSIPGVVDVFTRLKIKERR